jgi:hypothetical protein
MHADANNRGENAFIPTRSTLLSRLKDLGDDQSWRRFFDTYWKLIYVLREWPEAKVAKALGVSAARVHLAKHRVGKLVKMELKEIERECV